MFQRLKDTNFAWAHFLENGDPFQLEDTDSFPPKFGTRQSQHPQATLQSEALKTQVARTNASCVLHLS